MTDIKFPPMPKAHTVVKPKNSEPFGLITTRDALNFAAEAVRLNAQAVPCDCTTEIHADGTRKTWCGSDQMRRASEEGHAFAAAPQPAQQPLTEKDALLRQALEALENGARVRNAEGGTKYQPPIEEAAIDAIRNHLGVKND